ncbi:MAG: hypothetical protein KUL80_02460 [Comamonas sp.]|nr:hypothetical protein [Comamonas sp.]
MPKAKGVEMGMKKSEELALIAQGENALYGRLETDHAVKEHGENDVRF